MNTDSKVQISRAVVQTLAAFTSAAVVGTILNTFMPVGLNKLGRVVWAIGVYGVNTISTEAVVEYTGRVFDMCFENNPDNHLFKDIVLPKIES